MLTELKYRTFNQLLEDVSVDFSMYALENMIEPQQLIKVVQRVNYDLGLRINKTKEAVLDIVNSKVRLPDDFYVLNYAMLCGEYSITQPAISGTHREDVIVPFNPNCDDPCTCQPDTCLTQCGDLLQVIQTTQYETRTYEISTVISLDNNSKTISCDCPNLTWKSPYKGQLKNGYIYLNLDTGKVYINYEGTMEDEEGNLMVLDNPYVNEYYEYALKQRLLENLYMNGEDVVQKLNLVEQRLRAARNNALSLVNTPNFAEMYKMWEMNRKAQYFKYYDMFKSYNYNSWR
jgi:hypothetical protein